MRWLCLWRTRSSQGPQRRAPPNGPGRLECHKGCAGAWRTSPAGMPPEGALRTRPRRRTHASAPGPAVATVSTAPPAGSQ
eukprot:1306576-Alexandrium_andersonii.AAC.1